jgi:hypothetical protein
MIAQNLKWRILRFTVDEQTLIRPTSRAGQLKINNKINLVQFFDEELEQIAVTLTVNIADAKQPSVTIGSFKATTLFQLERHALIEKIRREDLKKNVLNAELLTNAIATTRGAMYSAFLPAGINYLLPEISSKELNELTNSDESTSASKNSQ